jgi:hypothetical protein
VPRYVTLFLYLMPSYNLHMLARHTKKDKDKKRRSQVGKLHSIESAAEFLGGLSPWTIRAWLSQGKLTRVKVGSRTMVLEKELIDMARPETPAEAAARNSTRERSRQATEAR